MRVNNPRSDYLVGCVNCCVGVLPDSCLGYLYYSSPLGQDICLEERSGCCNHPISYQNRRVLAPLYGTVMADLGLLVSPTMAGSSP